MPANERGTFASALAGRTATKSSATIAAARQRARRENSKTLWEANPGYSKLRGLLALPGDTRGFDAASPLPAHRLRLRQNRGAPLPFRKMPSVRGRAGNPRDSAISQGMEASP